MKFDVKGKICVVTGSTKGIGKGIAEALAENGGTVVICSRKQNECDAVAAEIREKYGVDAIGVSADITKTEAIENLFNTVMEKYGRVDVLVNNAGSAITKRAEDLTEEDFDHVLALDLRAVFFCSQAAGKIMIKQKSGKIISIASVLGVVADKQVLPYCVAKGGVLQMTRALALEWAKYNIQVNAICPGYVITELNRKELTDEKIGGGLLRKTAMRRFGEVEEIAGAAVYLASDASSYTTGEPIIVDGGWCAE